VPIHYIRNKKKKSDAYNILNAAFNYCGNKDIQVFIDGNFELIGKFMFSSLNWAYINNKENYIVYTNYKNTKYTVGAPHRLYHEHEYNSFDGRLKTASIP